MALSITQDIATGKKPTKNMFKILLQMHHDPIESQNGENDSFCIKIIENTPHRNGIWNIETDVSIEAILQI